MGGPACKIRFFFIPGITFKAIWIIAGGLLVLSVLLYVGALIFKKTEKSCPAMAVKPQKIGSQVGASFIK